MITITLPGEPVAWARTRGKFHHMPAHQRNVVALLKLKAEQAMYGHVMFKGALKIEFTALFDLPNSWSKKKQARMADQPVVKRPDFDNLAKLSSDAMNGIVYADDRQIAEAHIVKRYVSNGQSPAIIVTVSKL